MYCTAKKKKLEESRGHLHKEVTNHSIICKERKTHFFSLLSCSNRRGSLKCRGECQNLLIRDLFSKICHSCPPLPPSLSAGGGGGVAFWTKRPKCTSAKLLQTKIADSPIMNSSEREGFFDFPEFGVTLPENQQRSRLRLGVWDTIAKRCEGSSFFPHFVTPSKSSSRETFYLPSS